MANKLIVQALWYEPTTEFLNVAYNAGFLRNFLTFAKSVLSRDDNVIDVLKCATSRDRVAFCVFNNEINSAKKNKNIVNLNIELILKQKSLGFLLSFLGWKEVVKASVSFILNSIRCYGIKGMKFFAHPLLAYLLYIFLKKNFEKRKPACVIVFNLVHPLSVAVAKAAKESGVAVEYCEHAATTRMMLNNINEYKKLWVRHSHTKEMLVHNGVPPSNIEAFCPALTKTPIPNVVNRLGVCINDLDRLEDILSLAHYLSNKNVSVRYRIHDADKRYGKLKNNLTALGHTVESARSSSIANYFESINLLIAGNSNVIGDAIEHAIPVIYIWFGDARLNDYYGYVIAYNLECAYSTSNLLGLLDNMILKSSKI